MSLPRIPGGSFRFALAGAALLATVVILGHAPSARAQYSYLDTNGDGLSTAADRMNPAGTPTTIDVWLRTNQNGDGSTAVCITEDGELTINSYETILRAVGGTVSYGTFTNRQATMTTFFGNVSSSTDYYIGYGGGQILNPGLYRLFTIVVTTATGNPELQIVTSTPLSPIAQTSFGTRCSGSQFDNTYRLGSDWFDTSGAAANLPPVLSAPPTAFGAEGSLLTITANATDPDAADILTITRSGGPPSLALTHTPSISPAIATLSGTPGYNEAGPYTITWQVSDGVNSPVSATTNLTISNTDRAPIVTAPATASGAEGSLVTVNVSATDPDGESMTLSANLSNLPAGHDASFTTGGTPTAPTGSLTWTPGFTHAGTHSVGFTASNVLSGSASTSITIANTDRPPQLTAPATASGAEGSLLTVNVSATDPDGDATTLSANLTNLPAGHNAVFTTGGPPTAPTGTLTWTPGFTHAGTYSVGFTASNLLSAAASTAITIANTDLAPQVTAPATASGAEGSLLTVNVSASDPDGDATTLSANLTNLPAGHNASFTTGGSPTAPTGTLTWTPGFTHSGSYSVGFTASNLLSAAASTAITIANTDRAPQVTAPATASGAEGSLLTVNVSATDPDGDAMTLSANLSNLPAGHNASFTTGGSPTAPTGALTWTPGFTHSGSYSVAFTASNALSGSASTAITIANTDRPPQVTAPATASGAEGSLLTVSVSATDPDGSTMTLSANLSNLPAGHNASFTASGPPTAPTGTLTWTPGFTHAGSYSVAFTASNALSGSASTAITIANTDRPPQVTAPATASGAEALLLTVNVSATDPDGDAMTLSANLSNLPAGHNASFATGGTPTAPTGTLTWTPAYTHAGTYSVGFTASNVLSGSASTSITIANTDRPPQLTAPATASGAENSLLTVNVSATDPDGDATTLSANLTNLPAGHNAVFATGGTPTAPTGTLTWTPGFTHAGTYSVGFTASNALSGSASTAITIANTDRPPQVTAPATASGAESSLLTVNVSGTDPDGDATTLSANLTNLPAGHNALFTTGGSPTAPTGTLTWTPGFTHAGSYSVGFTASNLLSASATTTITIANTDRAPQVTAPATASGAEASLLTVNVSATDPDGDTMTLAANLTNLPAGHNASFTTSGPPTAPTGALTWTPGFTHAGGYSVGFTASNTLSATATTAITIANTDRPPQVTAPATVSEAEGSLLTVNVSASDPDGDATTLSANLTNLPAGHNALFTTGGSPTAPTGTLTWTPGFTHAGSYSVGFTASNLLSASASTAITIANTDRAPQVTAPATASGAEGSLLTVNVSATDPDGDTMTLSANLTNLPAGHNASFTTSGPPTAPTGTLTWTPGFTHAGTYSVGFTASNTLSASSTTAITIANTDRPPQVTAPATASGAEGSLLTVNVSGTDPDGDATTLTANLTNLPAGHNALFTTGGPPTAPTGTLTWTPGFTHAGSYSVGFTASNLLSAAASTAITIANTDRAPQVTAPATASGAEASLLTVNVSATDPDGDTMTLSANLSNLPAGHNASFTTGGSPTAPTGALTWTPGFAHAGGYSVGFTASNTLSATATTAITIANTDRPPQVTAPATAPGAEASLLTVNVSATDPDGDATTLSANLTNLPAGHNAVFTTGGPPTAPTGALTWTPGFTHAGNYSVGFTASNALSASATTAITIANTDRPPQVTAPATASGAEGSLLTVNVSGTDPDGGATTLSASLSNLPAGHNASFTTGGPPAAPTGTLTWTPAYTHAGSYSVEFTATNALTGSATTAITIANSDRPPLVTAPATASGAEGTLLTVNVSATDPDGDAMTLAANLTNLPAGHDAVFTSIGPPEAPTGALTWTPGYTHAGIYSVEFTATNALSAAATTAITIANTDRPPVLSSIPDGIVVLADATTDQTITATDPDGDAISFGGNLPPYVTIVPGSFTPGPPSTATATLRFQPGSSDDGCDPIEVWCFTAGAADSQDVTASVRPQEPYPASVRWEHVAGPSPLAPLPPPVSAGPECGTLSYVANGISITAVQNGRTGGVAAGTLAWTWTAPDPGATIGNLATPVVLEGAAPGEGALFVSAENGFVYKIDARTGAQLAASPDLRRPTCTSEDKVTATPAIQLRRFSNSGYQSGNNDDLVFVITRYGCGTSTENRIYGLNASDLTIKWIFNPAGASAMDFGSEGCAVDYNRNLIYCGTNQTTPGQQTLWAINTTDGTQAWSANAGSIKNRPMLNTSGSRLYVGTLNAGVKAYDPAASGSLVWTHPIPAAATITRNLSVERTPGPLGTERIFVTDTQGVLRAINDTGPSPFQLWQTRATIGVATAPAVSAAYGKVYVGLTDGAVHQIDWGTGHDQGGVVEASAGPMSEPTFDGGVAGELEYVNVASGSSLRRYLIPWGPQSHPTAVEEASAPAPTRVNLDRVAPNPFNPRTQIEYSLPSSGWARLFIYDVRGRLVTRLVNAQVPAGRHRAAWDGRDSHGSTVASGVYIARLEVGGSVSSRKLILAK